jgi:hypothetical protein
MYEMNCYYIGQTASPNSLHGQEYISSSTKKNKTDFQSTDQTDKRQNNTLDYSERKRPRKTIGKTQCYDCQKYRHLGRNCRFPDRRKLNLGPQTTQSVDNIVYRDNVENKRYLLFPPLSRNPAKHTDRNPFWTTETATTRKFKSDNFYKRPNNN